MTKLFKKLIRRILAAIDKNIRIKVFLQGSDIFIIKNIRTRLLKRRLKNLSSLPQTVAIEISTLCNADCVMCCRKGIEGPFAIIDSSLYRRIIDECASFNILALYIQDRGEPLLDSAVVDKVAYAKQKGIKCVGFFTNASLLNNKLSNKLIAAGLDFIVFSLDSNNKQIYESIRKGLEFDTVVSNINNFIRIRNECGNGKIPNIGINFIRMQQNAEEMKQFVRHWRKKVDYIQVRPLLTYSLPSNERLQCRYKTAEYRRRGICHRLWKHMVIHIDGTVGLCGYTATAERVMGDTAKQSLREIWNNSLFNRYREFHFKKRAEELALCDKCNIWKFPNEYPWYW